jgi:hypothetical protein
MNSSGVAATTKPPQAYGFHYKTWRTRSVLWFCYMNFHKATFGKTEGGLSTTQQEAFERADAMFKRRGFFQYSCGQHC